MSENARKMQERRKKNPKREPREKNASILHYALGKNASQLCLSRILLAFCSSFAHKCNQTTNPKHSVIWPLFFVFNKYKRHLAPSTQGPMLTFHNNLQPIIPAGLFDMLGAGNAIMF